MGLMSADQLRQAVSSQDVHFGRATERMEARQSVAEDVPGVVRTRHVSNPGRAVVGQAGTRCRLREVCEDELPLVLRRRVFKIESHDLLSSDQWGAYEPNWMEQFRKDQSRLYAPKEWTLKKMWRHLYDNITQPWLIDAFGRRNGEKETSKGGQYGGSKLPTLTFERTIDGLPATETVAPSTLLRGMNGKQWQQLAGKARVFYGVAPDIVDASITTVISSKQLTVTDPQDYVRAQVTAVAGPVYLLFDLMQGPKNPSVRTTALISEPSIILVSIAGINLEYGDVDIQRFVQGTRDDWEDDIAALKARINTAYNNNLPKKGTDVCSIIGRQLVGYRLDADAYVAAMERTWYVALEAMRRSGVRYPVLCAIGCGAFCGPFGEVPYLVAKALLRVMRKHYANVRSLSKDKENADTLRSPNNRHDVMQDRAFDAVIVCFPRGATNWWNYERFSDALSGTGFPDDARRVALFNECSMMHVADALAQIECRSGMLNPSDVMAVRGGWIGCYFDGGHIALEELLAVGTTALTMHRSLSPNLWANSDRWIPVPIMD